MMVQSVTWALLMLLAAAGLLLLMAAILVALAVARTPRRNQVVEVLGACLWCLPAVALLAWLGYRAVPHLQPPVVVSTEGTSHSVLRVPQGASLSVRPVAFETAASRPLPGRHDHDTATATVEESNPPVPSPEWTKHDVALEGEVTMVALHSALRLKLEDAERDTSEQAALLLKQDFEETHAPAPGWTVPEEAVSRAIRRRHSEVLPQEVGGATVSMYRNHVQVQLSPDVHESLYPSWRKVVVAQRLSILGSVLGVLTLMLGTTAAYFRVDQWTGGEYRGRLKLAATSVVLAGGLLAGAFLNAVG